MLSGCGNSGPSPEELFKKWLSAKAPQYWKQSGYAESGGYLTVTMVMESPYDIDYKKKPTWQKESDARRYCPSSSEKTKMGLGTQNVKVVTRGGKVGTLAEIICKRNAAQ